MKNELGDKCIVDSMKVIKDGQKTVLIAEVDGVCFVSTKYRTKKQWLNDIVKRVYACAMGNLNAELPNYLRPMAEPFEVFVDVRGGVAETNDGLSDERIQVTIRDFDNA